MKLNVLAACAALIASLIGSTARAETSTNSAALAADADASEPQLESSHAANAVLRETSEGGFEMNSVRYNASGTAGISYTTTSGGNPNIKTTAVNAWFDVTLTAAYRQFLLTVEPDLSIVSGNYRRPIQRAFITYTTKSERTSVYVGLTEGTIGRNAPFLLPTPNTLQNGLPNGGKQTVDLGFNPYGLGGGFSTKIGTNTTINGDVSVNSSTPGVFLGDMNNVQASAGVRRKFTDITSASASISQSLTTGRTYYVASVEQTRGDDNSAVNVNIEGAVFHGGDATGLYGSCGVQFGPQKRISTQASITIPDLGNADKEQVFSVNANYALFKKRQVSLGLTLSDDLIRGDNNLMFSVLANYHFDSIRDIYRGKSFTSR